MRSLVALSVPLFALTLAGSASAATTVPLAHFDGIGLTGGGHIVLKHGAAQRVTVLKGSTQFTDIKVEHGSLKIDACNSHCPQRYDLEIEIVTPELSALAVSGGGDIESAAGFPHQRDISVAVNGGGSIDLKTISIDTVNAAVRGGGDIAVHAETSLNAAVAGGGAITYWGQPQVSRAIMGGGEIERGS